MNNTAWVKDAGSFATSTPSMYTRATTKETEKAALLSKATHQATMAAKSIVQSGGTDSTALSTARAAAQSALCPGKSKRAPLSRRQAKRHAEIISSMALMSAIEQMSVRAPSPAGPPSNVEFQAEDSGPHSVVSVSHGSGGKNDITNQATGSTKQTETTASKETIEEPKKILEEPKEQKDTPELDAVINAMASEDDDIAAIQLGNTDESTLSDHKERYVATESMEQELKYNPRQTEKPRKATNLLRYFAKRADPCTNEDDVPSIDILTPRSRASTSDLASHVQLCDPIYDSTSPRRNSTIEEREPRDAEEAARGSHGAAAGRDEESQESQTSCSSTWEGSAHTEDDDNPCESFETDHSSNAPGFMQKNVDPFLHTLSHVFSCGPIKSTRRLTIKGVPAAVGDDYRDDVEVFEDNYDDVRDKAPRRQRRIPRGGQKSLDTFESEDILSSLNAKSTDSDISAILNEEKLSNYRKQSMESIVLRSLAGQAAARVPALTGGDERSLRSRLNHPAESYGPPPNASYENDSNEAVARFQFPRPDPDEGTFKSKKRFKLRRRSKKKSTRSEI